MKKTHDSIPPVDYFFMGGSSTFSLRFPEDLSAQNVRVLARRLVFATPYGDSPVMKLFEVDGKSILTAKMHGWRPGVSRADASRQIFWVLQKAGVNRIVAEGGVGAASHLLEPRDLVFPSDYIDFSLRKDVSIGGSHLLVMRDPICPHLSGQMIEAARRLIADNADPRRIFRRGVYGNTDGRHWESRAEVVMMRQAGCDVIGQSICPEVYLSREIGACYGRVDLVVNYAEGIVEDWRHAELKDIFHNDARFIGRLIIDTLRTITSHRECGCADLRKPTLLVDTEYGDQ